MSDLRRKEYNRFETKRVQSAVLKRKKLTLPFKKCEAKGVNKSQASNFRGSKPPKTNQSYSIKLSDQPITSLTFEPIKIQRATYKCFVRTPVSIPVLRIERSSWPVLSKPLVNQLEEKLHENS